MLSTLYYVQHFHNLRIYCLQSSTFLFFLIKNWPIKFYNNYCSTDTPVSVAQMGVSDDDLPLTTTAWHAGPQVPAANRSILPFVQS